jgi:hypothetical protein
MRKVAAVCVGLSAIAYVWWLDGATASAQRGPQRFDRVSMSGLDTTTHVDLFKDNTTGQCYAVYIRDWGYRWGAATPIGAVPCK